MWQKDELCIDRGTDDEGGICYQVWLAEIRLSFEGKVQTCRSRVCFRSKVSAVDPAKMMTSHIAFATQSHIRET